MKRVILLLMVLFSGYSGYLWVYPYTHEYKTDHFVIHYNADSVPARKDKSYVPLEKIDPGDFVAGDPDWVSKGGRKTVCIFNGKKIDDSGI
jgi:hypothetical protein